ncbi:hypothetical protein JCM14713_23110 [Desulfomicrobium salsuginis]
MQALTAAGINFFIDLTTSLDCLLPYRDILQQIDPQAEHHAFPVPDMGTPLVEATTCDILYEIDSALARGKGVYLHCWGGVGRTGTLVGCWLARHLCPGRRRWRSWENCGRVARNRAFARFRRSSSWTTLPFRRAYKNEYTIPFSMLNLITWQTSPLT